MGLLAKVLKRVLLAALVLVLAVCAVTAWRGYGLYRDALSRHGIEEAVAELKEEPGYRFYEHGGIDAIAICRAAVNDLRTLSLREGGSTITQQLAKNLFFTQEKRFSRKVAEVFMAFDLEALYSKREILELYVNSAYFGDGFTGIGQAAPGLLGKKPQDMTDYESTLMAGLPNAPNVLSAYQDAAAARQRLVVRQMEKYGFDPGTAG